MSGIRHYIPGLRPKNVVRILRLQGTIQNATSGRKEVLNLRRVEKAIDAAFESKRVKPKAVCLEISSPGGSAVQSNLIYTRIREQAKDKQIPVLSFVEDAAVSGGYWLSLAGDEIFVDPNSAVGSIGAVGGRVSLIEAMKKLGLEQHVITAGENKVRLNPFEPEKPEDIVWLKNILKEVHTNFIELVKERRPQLDLKHKTVFTGDVFLGKEAVRIGLADAIATDLKALCQKRFGKDVVLQRCELTRGFLAQAIQNQFKVDASINIDNPLDQLAIQGRKSRFGV